MPFRIPPHRIRMALFIGMELTWVAVLYNLIQAVLGLGDETPLAWVTALYPAAYLYLRGESRLPLHPAAKLALRTVLGVSAVIGAVAVLAWPDFPLAVAAPLAYDWLAFITKTPSYPALTLVAASFAVLRGGLLGPRHVDSRGFLAGFQLGIAVLFAIVFGQHIAGFRETQVVPGLLAFFAFGLSGLGANRWLRPDSSSAASRRTGWPLLGLAVIALILGVGTLFWTHFDARTVQLLLTPIFWIWDLLGRILAFLMSLLPTPEIAPMPQMPMPAMPAGAEAAREIEWGEAVRTIARTIFNVTLAVIVGWALLRNLVELLRWLSRRLGQSEGIIHERSDFNVLNDLRDLIRAIADLFRALWFRLGAPFRKAGPDHLPPEVRAVRTLYARLLTWAGKRGWRKPAGQTPYEFLDTLRDALPQLEPDLAALTDGYVAVRYGAARPRPDALRGLNENWRRIRKAKKIKRRKSAP